MAGRELEKLARELEEKKHQQELERLREEEEVKKKSKRYKRDGGKEKEEAAGKKGQQGGKQVSLKGTPAQLLHCYPPHQVDQSRGLESGKSGGVLLPPSLGYSAGN